MRIALLSLTTVLLSAPAFAADLGTYRPGTPYHSVLVPTANVCESQCAGDARCRGWNYVKPSPDAAGVCEFQSQVGAPISSAISISGMSPSAMPMSSRVVSGATNTVRVGTSIPPKTSATISRSPSGRQIIRQAVPNPQAGQPSAYRPMPAQQPGLRPMLESSGQMAHPGQGMPVYRGPARSNRQGQPMPRPQQMNPGQPQAVYQNQSYTRTPQGRPPVGQPIPAPSIQAHMSPQRQVLPAQAGQRQPMPRASVNNPVSWSSPQPQSLYGNLHDDRRVPQGQGVPQIPLGQSQPVPMTNAQPVAPVAQSQLAGAYPRN